MATKIALISEDKDFFNFIKEKLLFRKADELFSFSFDDVPERVHMLSSAVLFINGENMYDRTLDLLDIIKGIPAVVFTYNEDTSFKEKCYERGALDCLTILIPTEELHSRLIPILNTSSLLQKNMQYREILVSNKLLSQNNEVFLNYEVILDKELKKLSDTKQKAVFVAMTPNEKNKFLISANSIETAILSNIRRNDILINYAANKYFLILFDTDIQSSQKILGDIKSRLPQKIYVGCCNILNQSRQQLVNEVLNKLHEQIRNDVEDCNVLKKAEEVVVDKDKFNIPGDNFKLYRQEFNRKLEQVITPVFYEMQQKYIGKLSGIKIQQNVCNGYGTFSIKGKSAMGILNITSPGFAKINIDIELQKKSKKCDAKRIIVDPNELETGFLEDLLEQFINECKINC